MLSDHRKLWRGQSQLGGMVSRRRTALRGLSAYVQPVFFVPAPGMALFGGLLAGEFAPAPALVHVTAVATALYAAHLKDGYVDAFVREEEAPGPLSERSIRAAFAGATAAVVVLAGTLWWLAGAAATLLTLPLWALAAVHAPHLDTRPVTVTADYAVGIGLVAVGGYAAQTGTVTVPMVGLAAAYVLLLAGVKASVDLLDYEFDRSIGKRTLAVELGPRGARAASAALLACSALLLAGLAAADVLPGSAGLAAAFPLAGAAASYVPGRERTVRLQMGLTYPFTAAVFAAACLGWRCVVASWVL